MNSLAFFWFAVFAAMGVFVESTTNLASSDGDRDGGENAPTFFSNLTMSSNGRAGKRFAKCCWKRKVSCPEVCTYPPPDFSLSQLICMFSAVDDFIKCYTGFKNNVKCCEDHGVTGFYGICQDFCDGTTDHSWGPRYFACGPVKGAISKCNHDANESEGGEGEGEEDEARELNRTW